MHGSLPSCELTGTCPFMGGHKRPVTVKMPVSRLSKASSTHRTSVNAPTLPPHVQALCPHTVAAGRVGTRHPLPTHTRLLHTCLLQNGSHLDAPSQKALTVHSLEAVVGSGWEPACLKSDSLAM